MEYVKICGLKQYDHVQLCIDSGASAVGFIYKVPSSPRNLTSNELKSILFEIDNKISTVAVFKPTSVPELVKVMNDIPATLFQIHINFDIKELDKLSNYRKKKIILPFNVNEANRQLIIDQINDLKDQFFAFLIDNSEGHGTALDLELVQNILKNTDGARVIVAGGINANNVQSIINDLKPYGIDASSSLESERGVKDSSKIKEFLEIIKKNR